MKDKRGLEISFQLIFAAIAGIIIFLFLIYFAFQNVDLFEARGETRARADFVNFFDTLSASSSSLNLDFDEEMELNFFCFDEESSFSVGDSNKERITGKFVFVDGDKQSIDNLEIVTLNGKSFSVWSLPWKVPFKVANLIFLTERDKSYNLQGFDRDFLGKIPSNFLKVGGEDSEFKFQNGFVACNAGDYKINYRRDPLTEVSIGEICLNGEPMDFVGDAMAFAAIFGKGNFHCLKNKLNERLGIVTQSYINKLDDLSGRETECNYVPLELDLLGLRDSSDRIQALKEIRDGKTLLARINSENLDLLRSGCAGVF